MNFEQANNSSTLLAYEALLALVVLTCALSSAFTTSIAHRCFRKVSAAGETGGPLLFAWMRYRLEALLFATQLLSLVASIYRLWEPDLLGATLRTAMSILIAVALAKQRRDYSRLGD